MLEEGGEALISGLAAIVSGLDFEEMVVLDGGEREEVDRYGGAVEA